jgi:hypothetical protein
MKKAAFIFIFLWSPLVIAQEAHQETPEALGQLWVAAIKAHSVEMINPLIHPNCPKESIKPQVLKRMVEGDLPAEYVITPVKLGSTRVLEKIYYVVPDMQLNIKYVTKTKEEKKKFGLGKGFPIASFNGKWFFTICTKK